MKFNLKVPKKRYTEISFFDLNKSAHKTGEQSANIYIHIDGCFTRVKNGFRPHKIMLIL